MERLSIKEASRRLGMSPQALRVLIQHEKIPGAICDGPKHRRTYYIYESAIENFTKGGSNEGR